MTRNYDTIAGIYDQLATIVFGQSQANAQIYLLQCIPAGTHILIAGGGTGLTLEALAKLHPTGLHITHVDASAKMTAMAQQRNCGGNAVTFITAPAESLAADKMYDVVITPFFFDNLDEATAEKAFYALHNCLTAGGLLLHTDFRNTGILWQRLLLRSMYIFFRLCCGIKANRLPDMEKRFMQEGYTTQLQRHFYSNMIVATAYQKK